LRRAAPPRKSRGWRLINLSGEDGKSVLELEACETLCNESKRKEYDNVLKEQDRVIGERLLREVNEARDEKYFSRELLEKIEVG
jgi:hypothetical protein